MLRRYVTTCLGVIVRVYHNNVMTYGVRGLRDVTCPCTVDWEAPSAELPTPGVKTQIEDKVRKDVLFEVINV